MNSFEIFSIGVASQSKYLRTVSDSTYRMRYTNIFLKHNTYRQEQRPTRDITEHTCLVF